MDLGKIAHGFCVGIAQLTVDYRLRNHFTQVCEDIPFIPVAAISTLEDIHREFGHY